MKFGICCAPNALGDPRRLLDLLHEAGADYAEWSVGSVMASEAEFEKLRAVVAEAPIKPEAFCSFLPPLQRLTGPNINLANVLTYASEAIRRCRALGAEVIVLGSGSARKVPAGFPHQTALQQFQQFCRELGPYAQAEGVVIAIEPLNHTEDNLITTVKAGAQMVDAVAHPNIQLLADFYHMFSDDEPLENVVTAGSRLQHAHLADLERFAPGFAPAGEADFVGFFGALKATGYDKRCSFEGKTRDFISEIKPALQTMRDRHQKAM